MDGTIADLYNVQDWLIKLQASDPTPYIQAEPIYNMQKMRRILLDLKRQGWQVIVTTWLCKDSSKAYKESVRRAKREWLERHNFPYDRLHMVKYGRTKADSTRDLQGYQILFDDNIKVRQGWTLGDTVDAEKINILEYLKNLA